MHCAGSNRRGSEGAAQGVMRVRVWGMVAPYIDHGTQLMQLKPSSILAAAEEDVVRFRRNTNTEAWDCQAYGALVQKGADFLKTF